MPAAQHRGRRPDRPEGGPDEQATPLPMGNAANPARIIEQQIINQDAAPAPSTIASKLANLPAPAITALPTKQRL